MNPGESWVGGSLNLGICLKAKWGCHSSRCQIGMIEMDTLNMLSTQMSNVVKLVHRQVDVGPSSSSSNIHVACCSICGSDHDTNECIDFEQAQFINNSNRNAQNNPYSNSYNPEWRNHPNFG